MARGQSRSSNTLVVPGADAALDQLKALTCSRPWFFVQEIKKKHRPFLLREVFTL
jgi:hypothetical protein